jgi:hypothetical protein
VAIEYRHAGSQYERLPELAADLFRRQAAVIVAIGDSTPARAATSPMTCTRLASVYAGRILNGAEPGESPVMLPTRFELVINDRTAKALRVAVPRRRLSRADEIID